MRVRSKGSQVDLALEIAAVAAGVDTTRELAERALPAFVQLFDASFAACYRHAKEVDDGYILPGYDELLQLHAQHVASDPLLERKRHDCPDVIVLTQAVDRLAFRRSAVYEVYRRFDVDELLFIRSPLRDPGGDYLGLLLTRSRQQRPWSGDELALASKIPALLGTLLERQERVSRGSPGPVDHDTVAADEVWLRFTRDGRLESQSETAARLRLAVYEPLALAIRRLARVVRDGSIDPGPDHVDVRLPDERRLIVELRLDGSPASEQHIIARGHASCGAISIVQEFIERYRLSRAEWVVLRALQSGRTNAEIARELHLSPHTVRTHLMRIYDKLGVSTRLAAVLKIPPNAD